MEIKLHAMEIQKILEQREEDTIENIKLKGMIKELEEKVNHDLTLNNIEGNYISNPLKRK